MKVADRATQWLPHAAAVLFLAPIAVAWTWPLAAHLHDALAGDPGDNFSFVWNLWWMRTATSTPGSSYFHTTYLFYPFGTSIANHPHTALPAFIAATLLRAAEPVTAQNLLLLAYVFLNLAAMYAFAWDVTRAILPSLAAAVVFGLSPYLSVHLLGHFDLVAAWPIPLFALALRRAVERGSTFAAIGAGVLLAATAYTAYYYVVYLVFLSVFYVVSRLRLVRVSFQRYSVTPRQTIMFAVATASALFSAILIATMGGRTWSVGSFTFAARSPRNAITAMWIVLAGWAAVAWRPRVSLTVHRPLVRQAVATVGCTALVFSVLASPLVWEALRLVVRHEYVSQPYVWRNVPNGVDAIAPFLAHPLHPLAGSFSMRAYSWLGQSYIETIGWLGITPVVLLVATRRARREDADVRAWSFVGIAFAVWCLGPFLRIGGVDTGLSLPAVLLRFVPFVANARMPGRAIVIVYMIIGLAIATGLARTTGRLASPVIQAIVIALIAFEYWDAPIRLTRLDTPAVYRVLAAAPPGAVCDVPFGIGDGLSAGVGWQDRRNLWFATKHGHPLVGGYIGRMPADAEARYDAMPIAGTLLRLSAGGQLQNHDLHASVGESPCRYLVVNRAVASEPLLDYVAALRGRRLADADGRELIQLY